MIKRGHNETPYRLDVLARDAKGALMRVANGEAEAIEGWLIYGAALNEGRSLFPGDREFGQWVEANVLCQVGTAEVDRHERAAAMWAAANEKQFEEARAAGGARTIRGIHAKWKQIEAEREEEARKLAEKEASEQTAERVAEEAPAAPDQGGADMPQSKPDQETKPQEDMGEPPAAKTKETAQSKPDQEDPDAKLRAEFKKLTPEAIEGDWIGMRQELAERDERIAKQRSDIADLKSRVKELTSDENSGRTIGKLQERLRQSEGRSKEHQQERARLQRQVNMQKDEIKRLKAELENQVIPL